MSHTIFVSEKARWTFRALDDEEDGPLFLFDRYGYWFAAGGYHTLFGADYPPNAYKTFPATSLVQRMISASSLHPGGVNVLMGDGSVRFVNETIQSAKSPYSDPPGVWQALASRNGGEIIETSAY